MTRFPTAGHLVSWAKFAPGVKESAGNPRAADRPGTATRISLGCSARPPSPPARPIPSLVNATGGSPVDAASNARSSRSAGPSWSSSGTCCPTRGPVPRPRRRLLRHPHRSRTRQAQPHPPARGPRLKGHPRTRRLTGRHRTTSATLTGSRAPPGCCRVPAHRGFSDQDEAGGSTPPRPTKRPLTSRNADPCLGVHPARMYRWSAMRAADLCSLVSPHGRLTSTFAGFSTSPGRP